MKIWLDDERDPTEPFIQKNFGANGNEIWIKTAEEAMELLKSKEVTYISFDHDLGTILSGYDVAKCIEELAFQNQIPRLQYCVHTMNPLGRLNILQAMRKADEYWGKNESF